MNKSICVVVGVGEGNGAALARAFSNEGMAVALLARGTDFLPKDARPKSCRKVAPCEANSLHNSEQS